MTEQEIFGDQRVTVAHGRTDEAEEEHEILEHRPKIMPHGAQSRASRHFAPSHALPTVSAHSTICDSTMQADLRRAAMCCGRGSADPATRAARAQLNRRSLRSASG
jgi:hypothetical protein